MDGLVLALCAMELLSKGRLMYHLFDDDAEVKKDSPRLHSVLPIQQQDTSLCPFAKKPELDPDVAASHSAVLMMLAPVEPSQLARTWLGATRPSGTSKKCPLTTEPSRF